MQSYHDSNLTTCSFCWHVTTLAWEQELKLENLKPAAKRLPSPAASWYETNLKFVKETILPQLQPTASKEDYEIKIFDIEQLEYEHANGAHKPGLVWEGKLEVYDKKNPWRGVIEKTGAQFKNKEQMLKCLQDDAEKMINYDLQHNRELMGFKQGLTAICSCGKPVSIDCDNHFHECETMRQHGYTFKKLELVAFV